MSELKVFQSVVIVKKKQWQFTKTTKRINIYFFNSYIMVILKKKDV